ncbi:hypothetical protein EYF80_032929 [Liparis tanakae]|uniref:Uncharacterized protein n=1 Tax=Liparis tanakae TaxID=230148 RepID=A0A4Z2GVQ2_9TELE|nr:hypothetical protein EYF80_032929 [Liparis tanakae]
MKLQCLLLSIALSCCSAEGDLPDPPPAALVMGVAQSPIQWDDVPKRELVQDQQPDQLWRKEVLDLLTQLVLVQKEVASGQVQVVQLLGMLGTQGSQQIQDLQTVALHQGLLVESHQALLLQASRIATSLVSKDPAPSQ